YAKANPGKISFASSGVGSSIHMSRELFKAMAKINMLHVPYRGIAAGGLSDLITGVVHVAFDNLPSSIELIRSGKVRALAVTTTVRSELLPDVPTVDGRAKGHVCRDRGKAQQGAQCRVCRSEDEGTDCRARWHAASRLSCRLHQVRR